jgi:hypothetical protein
LEPDSIIGPLLGALFIDPLWTLTTVSMVNFCDEEILLVNSSLSTLNAALTLYKASKCLGSHRPKELENLNRNIFSIIYRMAIGELQSSELVDELLHVLESEETAVTVRKHSKFYTMSGEIRE